jgi:hypothetical protein
MIDKPHRRQPVPDRARKRAIRAQAARTGVPYTVAARQLGARAADHPFDAHPSDAGPFDAGSVAGMPASQGRTIYPAGADDHRRALIECRERRSATQRLLDARLAADLPAGRARHLADRFPPTRGEDGSGVRSLYHGAGRCEALELLYLVLAHERPDLVPSAGDLAWEAELGEETAIDTACARLDRAARELLDLGGAESRSRIDAATAAAHAATAESGTGPAPAAGAGAGGCGGVTTLLRVEVGRPAPVPGRLAFEGARQILDAVLMVAEDGHAPGTRVRVLAGAHEGATGTIVGAYWDRSGPPGRYEVRPDGWPGNMVAFPDELWVLSRDELPLDR